MLVASAREETTGPTTNTGLMTTRSRPCCLASSQAAFSANVCNPLAGSVECMPLRC